MVKKEAVNLSDHTKEPSDEDLNLIMKDVSLVAISKAKKAETDFFENMSKTISNRYSPGFR